jgi:hypothetical protein
MGYESDAALERRAAETAAAQRRVDPSFPRYRIPETTIDGPRVHGVFVEVRLWCRVLTIAGTPIQLRVEDFGLKQIDEIPGAS